MSKILDNATILHYMCQCSQRGIRHILGQAPFKRKKKIIIIVIMPVWLLLYIKENEVFYLLMLLIFFCLRTKVLLNVYCIIGASPIYPLQP